MSEFQVKRRDPHQHRIVETDTDTHPLKPGQIRVRIDRFALTANNITYAVAGDQIGYWQFFPATDNDSGDWGIIPVWGFADIVESALEALPVGERLYGYFPPATALTLTPVGVTATRFIDGSAHRAALPAGYNLYQRVAADLAYDRASDAARALLFPLHITGWCLWDDLRINGAYGADQVIIVSASSKTSIGLAYGLDEDRLGTNVIGLTSDRNRDFVTGLGCYDQVVGYDDLEAIDATRPTVIVDMAGNTALMAELHTRLGDQMKQTIRVGLTHWDRDQTDETGSGIIAERSHFFFAPGHIQKRIKDLGPDAFNATTTAFMSLAAKRAESWLKVRDLQGLDGMATVYGDVCSGRLPPNQGLIIRP